MSSLARYHARLPRYVLNATDNSLIRYSGAARYAWEENTEIQNISLTGLSFTAPQDIKPQLGEVIRIEFSVPGSEQMACHALVTRIENLNSSNCVVALHFYKLERLQRINLVQGLTLKNAIHQNENEYQKLKTSQNNINLFLIWFYSTIWICSLAFNFYGLNFIFNSF